MLSLKDITNTGCKRMWFMMDITSGKYDHILLGDLLNMFKRLSDELNRGRCSSDKIQEAITSFIADWQDYLKLTDSNNECVDEFVCRCYYVADMMNFEEFTKHMRANKWDGKWFKPEQFSDLDEYIESLKNDSYEKEMQLAREIAAFKYSYVIHDAAFADMFGNLVRESKEGGPLTRKQFNDIFQFLKRSLLKYLKRYYGADEVIDAGNNYMLKELLGRLK